MKYTRILFTLLMITAMVLGASGQVYKLETSAHQFVVIDTTRSAATATVFRYPAKDTRFRESGNNSFRFYNENNQTLGSSVTYSVSNTVDADGDAFASYSALIDFLDRNTGGIPLETSVAHTLTEDSVTTGFLMNGEYTFGANGTWGSGNLLFQLSKTLGSGYATYATFTKDTLYNVKCGECYGRWNLSSSSSPDLDTSVNKIK